MRATKFPRESRAHNVQEADVFDFAQSKPRIIELMA